jgi:hypothetical protein
MFCSAIILYFDESPVGYDCFREGDKYLFIPAPAPTELGLRPVLEAHPKEDGWQVIGINDPGVHDQVIRWVHTTERTGFCSPASAAT